MYDLLAGLRIVEASAFVAGPSCALGLHQLGADVIRIDALAGGPDYGRWPLDPPSGRSLYWQGLNKGKKSVTLDLARPEGRELAQALVTAPGENAGLFVTNYPVSGIFGDDQLRPKRPDLISLRIMGWPDGRTGVDYTVNASCGVPFMTGPEGSAEPVNHVLPAWDLLAGAQGVGLLLAAERRRRMTGEGADMRLALSDVAAASLANLGHVAEVSTTGSDREKNGNALFGAFGRDFLTADGARLMVVAITARQWAGLLGSLDISAEIQQIENRTGADFARNEGHRFTWKGLLFPVIEAAIGARTTADLAAAFDANGVCWSTYRTVKQALADPSFAQENPLFASVRHPGGLFYPTAGAPAMLVHEDRGAAEPAPELGEHTEEVLSGVLGLPASEIGRLRDSGIIGPDRAPSPSRRAERS